ncbi:hypothetical protein B0H19DRAFT_1267023 [Mycena capillaripes]|nr:hypothetical protein B0H19DRAFT_1267023 [Mycena capillaripes]
MDGHTLPLPPAILGRIGNDKSKKTVLIYGYFDVQPAAKSDGWDTEPFVLVEEKDGRLVGRGSTDDKGPVLGWLGVLQWHHETQTPLPVNLMWIAITYSDNCWLNTRTLALTYGLRGLVYLKITASGPGHVLHSGTFGRTVHEPMASLIFLMSRRVDSGGNILIPGVDDMASAAEEWSVFSPTTRSISLSISLPSIADPRPLFCATHDKLDYGAKDVEDAAGGKIALSGDKLWSGDWDVPCIGDPSCAALDAFDLLPFCDPKEARLGASCPSPPCSGSGGISHHIGQEDGCGAMTLSPAAKTVIPAKVGRQV